MITEESFIDFACPYCGQDVSFPAEAQGLLRECVNCMEGVIVPRDGSAIGGKIPIPISSKRLILRRLKPEDWSALLECWPDESEEFVIDWLEKESQVKITTSGQT